MSQFGDLIWLNICGESSGLGYLHSYRYPLFSPTAFYAMSFLTPLKAASVQSIYINLTLTGAPTNIVCDICSIDAATGLPDSATGVIATTTIVTPVAGTNQITFASPPALSVNTQYYLVIRGNDTVNYVQVNQISQGSPPTFTYNLPNGRCANKWFFTTTGDGDWYVGSYGHNNMLIEYTDGSWSGTPLHSFGASGNVTSPYLTVGNQITLPADAPDMWLSAVHTGCRHMGTMSGNNYKMSVFENNNLIYQRDIPTGPALSDEINSDWSDRVFYLDKPALLRGGNSYLIGFTGHARSSADSYWQSTGALCIAGKHSYLPFNAVKAERTAAGVLTTTDGNVVAMALGLNLMNPFNDKPLNRRQFNNQR